MGTKEGQERLLIGISKSLFKQKMIVLITYCLYYNNLCICKASSIYKVLKRKVCVCVCVCVCIHEYMHASQSVCVCIQSSAALGLESNT